MIVEYHLVSHAQGSLSLSLVLPEAATELLPPLDKYTGGVGFRVTRDVRVVDRAKTLQIATWLHHLDMAVAEKDQIASQTLEAAQHKKGLSCGSTSGSNDGQPHLRGGCWLGPG